MIPCQLAKKPQWRCRVNVKILMMKLNSLCFVAGAPSTLVKAGPNIDKEVPELVGKVGVGTDSCISSVDTMDWLSFPVQEIHERRSIVGVQISVNKRAGSQRVTPDEKLNEIDLNQSAKDIALYFGFPFGNSGGLLVTSVRKFPMSIPYVR